MLTHTNHTSEVFQAGQSKARCVGNGCSINKHRNAGMARLEDFPMGKPFIGHLSALRSLAREQPLLRERILHLTNGRLAEGQLVCKGWGRRIILASTSPYRQILLERLHIPFGICKPDFKEAEPGDMPPNELVRYNTLGKAASVVGKFPDATVIASDQIAVCGDTVLGKPGDHDAACLQLQQLSGKSVDFLTGIALAENSKEHYKTVPFRVHFRQLSTNDIETYVRTEQPYDCAGSFKSEGLGICLFERMEGDDPTALMGLPLITLSGWLQPLNVGH